LAAGLEVKAMTKWGNINDSSSRSNQIATKIIQHQPDIICLQELNRFEDILQFLSPFQFTGLQLLKSQPVAPHVTCDGVGIFWSTIKYKLLDTLSIKLSERWNQVCLALILEIIDTGKTVLVAATHLKAKQDESQEQTRLQQVENFTESVNNWLSTVKCPEPELRCFVGDMNSSPDAGGGLFKKEWKAKAMREFEKRGYKSAWHVFEAKRKGFDEDDKIRADAFTFKTRGEVGLYDYIMYKGKVSVDLAKGPLAWSDPTFSYTNNPSDHLPLFVSFRLDK
jgi:endonuclease/exonuclease/phosphatase family metal-dependent hydrolase